MKKSILYTIIICILIIGGYSAIQYTQDKNITPNDQTEEVEQKPEGDPVFTWEYVYNEQKEIPETTLRLTAQYPNDVTQTKVIDTVDGSCNQYDTRDKDVYEKSEMVICYYAGLGHYYKIVQSEKTYLVQRRIFEEASPDYNPPKLPFETIATF